MLNQEEQLKRKREKRIALLVFFAFVGLTFVLAGISRRQGNPFVESLGYFALINLNVILVMLLVFLVIRNLVKAYLLRRTGKLGSSLRWRMMSSMLAFTLLPSVVLFVASTYIMRQGFEQWLGGQVSQALEDAQAISTVHYGKIETELEFFAEQIKNDWSNSTSSVGDMFEKIQSRYPVDGLEFYESLAATPKRILKVGLEEWAVPKAALESLERAFSGQSFHLIRQFGDGDLVQRFVMVQHPLRGKGVLVLSQVVPLGLKSRMTELRAAFGSYKKTRLLKDSLKTQYTLILLTLFVLIVFVVGWFGLYLARSVTDPVGELMKATEAIRDGRWNYRIENAIRSDAVKKEKSLPDLELLKAAFNLMAEEVGRRGHKLEEANAQLISLVDELEERERYLENLLSSIRKGVVVLDNAQRIKRINEEALLFAKDAPGKLKPADALEQNWFEVFPGLGSKDESLDFLEQTGFLEGRSLDRIFDVERPSGEGKVIVAVRATGILLIDESRNKLGWLILLEDVSDAARLERLAAWQEVARRVAHEIKNPLTPIQLSADRLTRKFRDQFAPESDEARIFSECMTQIHKQVKAIRELVREFSQFAKLPEPRLQNLRIDDLIDETLGDYKMNHPDVNFEFSNKVPSETPFVKADPEYMKRLMVNLIDNSLQALDEAKISKKNFKIELETSSGDPNFWSLSFEDNGPGIPPALREKIFDPYVTNKASGLGLGLPIVRRIAIEHSGRIRCEEGAGARFVLELPKGLVKESHTMTEERLKS